ncbi:MAG: glycosyltransferase [Desulfovibrionaceae bacterium]
MTKVSVLMSVKNGLPYVRETVDSVLGQTLADFTFLILDNASTDGTRDFLQGIGDPRVRLELLSEDVGQTAALNTGLSIIQTGLVARMDADDVCLPERLERQIERFEADPDLALLGAAAEMIDERGRRIGEARFPCKREKVLEHLPLGNPFVHASVMYRCELALAVGGYPHDFTYAQDLALWLRLAGKGGVENLPETLVNIRVHEAQATRDARLRSVRLEDNLRLAREMESMALLPRRVRDAARLRQAFMLWGLGNKSEALRTIGGRGAVWLAGCAVNPIFWRAAWSRLRAGLSTL